MMVKCVHTEVVTDLSTVKFVEAMHWFIPRRGVPSHKYSDNGTNFVGTCNLIICNRAEIESFAISEGINWSMIPARSPHFGGLWDSAVRSTKYHFAQVNVGNMLSYDEYCTLVAHVDAVLNLRPLCTIVNQGDEVLTPGNFLIGQSLSSRSEFEDDTGSKSLTERLIEVNKRFCSFWTGWSMDYLNQLQRRYKWQREEPDVQVGQVVLLKDESRPFKWPFAIIQKVYPDDEDRVRVMDVKAAKTPTRP